MQESFEKIHIPGLDDNKLLDQAVVEEDNIDQLNDEEDRENVPSVKGLKSRVHLSENANHQDLNKMLAYLTEGENDPEKRQFMRQQTRQHIQKNMQDPLNALVAFEDEDGVHYSNNWSVEVHQVSGLVDRDVYNVTCGDLVIAETLYLYEAAHAIVELLQSGHTINDQKMLDILNLEIKFARHYDDAERFMIRYRESTNPSRKDTYLSRYQHAKDQAQQTRQELSSLINNK